MVRFTVAFAALVFAARAGAEVGLGASLNSDDATIYIPISPKRFMIEPYVRHQSAEQVVTSTTSSGAPGTADIESLTFGVGVFHSARPRDNVELYYGARLGYVEQELESVALITSPFPIPPSTSSGDADGYSFAPTIGFQYRWLERFSIGADFGWEYLDVESTTINTPSFGSATEYRTKQETTETHTNIIFRFFF